MKLLRLYLEDGSTPPLDLIHMRISPWYQFRSGSLDSENEHIFRQVARPTMGRFIFLLYYGLAANWTLPTMAPAIPSIA